MDYSFSYHYHDCSQDKTKLKLDNYFCSIQFLVISYLFNQEIFFQGLLQPGQCVLKMIYPCKIIVKQCFRTSVYKMGYAMRFLLSYLETGTTETSLRMK